ncbi:MAG: hypothetical protein AAGA75_09215 [Cyanobacteria bacterium P01_E01_bin.6]
MSNPQKDNSNPKKAPQAVLTIDPGTLVFIISAAILLPLLITGFLSQ